MSVSTEPLNVERLVREFSRLGVTDGEVLMVHSSLSALGRVEGGAPAVVEALRQVLGETGTLVVPAFTPQIADPQPGADPRDQAAARARAAVPVFADDTPTPMGAIASAVLATAGRRRSSHPQASVAVLGAAAADITARQPLGYAVGENSPFSRMAELGGKILLIGVGHNRSSFLHHAESRLATHRTKLRRFPFHIEGQRVWVEVPDVGDDNNTFFPMVGAEFTESGPVTTGVVGEADCQLFTIEPYVQFAAARFAELLRSRPEDSPSR